MGQAVNLAPNVDFRLAKLPVIAQVVLIPTTFIVLYVARHIIQQLCFANKNEPPVVFSWLPLIGSTIEYGTDPYKFYAKYQKKYGNVFTFVLIGRKHTVCLGPEGNNFVLNGALSDTSAADIYRDLTVPIFGKDVCYDCSPAKFMEQKKFMKYSLTQDKLEKYVPIFLHESHSYVKSASCFEGNEGIFDVVENISPLTLYTAAASLQGKEVRQNLDGELAHLYHDLDKSFIPINFYLPGLPLPVNRKRDLAHKKIVNIYTNIITARKALGAGSSSLTEDDMISNLMNSVYKDGNPVPEHEIAHTMIGLLMAGQHNSYSVASWILLRLATRPDLQEELYQEQMKVFGSELNLEANCDDIDRLSLHKMVVRETLRLHSPIHTMMRAVKTTLTISSKDIQSSTDRTYRIPPTHVLISSPGNSGRSEEFFHDPENWEPRRWDSTNEFLDETEKSRLEFGKVSSKVSKGANSAYLPFGAGRHRCVGEMFAYVQLSTIIAYMVNNFTFENPPGVKGVPPTDYSSMMTRPVLPARLVWKRRSKN